MAVLEGTVYRKESGYYLDCEGVRRMTRRTTQDLHTKEDSCA